MKLKRIHKFNWPVETYAFHADIQVSALSACRQAGMNSRLPHGSKHTDFHHHQKQKCISLKGKASI